MFITAFVLDVAFGSHFRGGTISWRYNGRDNQVEFKFRLSWAIGSTGCSTGTIGNLTTRAGGSWNAIDINQNTVFSVSDVNYICSAVNANERWEIGERKFTYNFTTKGPYQVSFQGGAWISLDYGVGGGSWNVETTVYLNERSDTRNPNNSPETSSRAMYRMQFGCSISVRIPLVDTDGDIVRCRWATPQEAASIAGLLPNATLDETNCTITFLATANNSYSSNGWFAVALTIEDFPRNNIAINGRVYTPSTALSQVPLQFLITLQNMSESCNEKPTFIPSSPVEGSVIILNSSETLNIRYYVHSPAGLVSIDINGLTGLSKSSINPDDQGRMNVSFVDVSWNVPESSQTAIICATAEDINGKLSDTQCFTVLTLQESCYDNLCAYKETKSPLGSTNAVCTECFIAMLLICVPCVAFIYLCIRKSKVKPELNSRQP